MVCFGRKNTYNKKTIEPMNRLAYILKAKTQYNLHSPFVFDLYNEALLPRVDSKKLKMNAYRVDKYVLSLGRVPIDLIERALEKLYELDLTLKSTQSDAWTMIECFVSDIYMPKSLR